MLKNLWFITLSISGLILLIGCHYFDDKQNIEGVGMLIEDTLHQHPWEEKGYEGLLAVSEEFNVDVFFEENVKSEQDIIRTVDQWADQGVNLIFGHDDMYGRYFVNITEHFPDIHFVYFNGGYYSDNVTSLNFDSHAMGFFSGMVASKMTESNHIGILAAHEWQPEIEGFYEGVKYEDPAVKVHFDFIRDWDDIEVAFEIYEEMKTNQADVIYPTGESFSEEILEQASNDHIFGIGYGSDQSHVDQEFVLTSTIQHVDKLYTMAAERIMEQSLEGGILYFDFQDGVISLGQFSPKIPTAYQEAINQYIDVYKETNLLPHEQ